MVCITLDDSWELRTPWPGVKAVRFNGCTACRNAIPQRFGTFKTATVDEGKDENHGLVDLLTVLPIKTWFYCFTC
jgi:hypothetical protein